MFKSNSFFELLLAVKYLSHVIISLNTITIYDEHLYIHSSWDLSMSGILSEDNMAD